ncbi:MAG: helix-turn-helix domain-containing protein [Bacteroidales bacterium]|nr:helix-turn-helix domain-containing protein [Bacteroidales bacterium]
MYIPIKGMVCLHCIRAVELALEKAGISGATVSLGGADIPDIFTDTPGKLTHIDKFLQEAGFERITGTDAAMVEKTKLIIMDHVRNSDCNLNLSACLQSKLNTEYSQISKLFSSREGRTIEKYAIAQRIEFVKELLSYRELSISEIADRAGYSSVAHLSRQFKSVTGLTPTAFINSALPRIPLNKV